MYRTSPKHAAQKTSPHVSHAKLARDTAPRPCAHTWHRSSSGTGAESGGTLSRKEFRRPIERPMSVTEKGFALSRGSVEWTVAESGGTLGRKEFRKPIERPMSEQRAISSLVGM